MVEQLEASENSLRRQVLPSEAPKQKAKAMTTPDHPTEHNPDNLTPEQYGAPEWRLLTKEEYGKGYEYQLRGAVERWMPHSWVPFCSSWFPFVTYRKRVTPPAEAPAVSAEVEPASCAECGRLRKLMLKGNGEWEKQFEAKQYDLEKAEAERDSLRAELSRLQAELEKLSSQQSENIKPE